MGVSVASLDDVKPLDQATICAFIKSTDDPEKKHTTEWGGVPTKSRRERLCLRSDNELLDAFRCFEAICSRKNYELMAKAVPVTIDGVRFLRISHNHLRQI